MVCEPHHGCLYTVPWHHSLILGFQFSTPRTTSCPRTSSACTQLVNLLAHGTEGCPVVSIDEGGMLSWLSSLYQDVQYSIAMMLSTWYETAEAYNGNKIGQHLLTRLMPNDHHLFQFATPDVQLCPFSSKLLHIWNNSFAALPGTETSVLWRAVVEAFPSLLCLIHCY